MVQHRIEGNPDYGDLTVELAADELILVESGAMSRMSSQLELTARMPGGLLGALARKFLGRESLLLGEYRSPHGGSLSLSPATPGTVLHREMRGDTFSSLALRAWTCACDSADCAPCSPKRAPS